MHGTEINIMFTCRKFVTIYLRSTLHEKMDLQKRQICLDRLSIPL